MIRLFDGEDAFENFSEWTEGYNTMLSKAIKVIEEY